MHKLQCRSGGSNPYLARRQQRLEVAHSLPVHTEHQWALMLTACWNRCVKCGATDRRLQRDHIMPVSMHGTDHIDNLQPMCWPCNRAKGASEAIDYRPDDWREFMFFAGAFDE